MLYLDANATTTCSAAVAAVVAQAMVTAPGNPSSIHLAGAEARAALEAARDQVCLLIEGALPEGVVFNSGGTEGNNAVLKGIAGAAIVTTNVEHASVTRPAQHSGHHIEVAVSQTGLISPDAMAAAIPMTGPVIISVQWANSETGVIQPIAEIVEAARRRRKDAFIHVDAAQAIGRVPVCIDGIDALTCSGHKLHGPAGTGVLVFGDPEEDRLEALISGGGQERKRRSGTQNVPGAVGLGLAFKARAENFRADASYLAELRDEFERRVLSGCPGSLPNGAEALRVPNTSNILLPGIDAMALVSRLDQEGVACSVGSACSSGRPEPSPVLLAMGYSERSAQQSARFSFSVMNTKEEAIEAADIVVRTARAMA